MLFAAEFDVPLNLVAWVAIAFIGVLVAVAALVFILRKKPPDDGLKSD